MVMRLSSDDESKVRASIANHEAQTTGRIWREEVNGQSTRRSCIDTINTVSIST